MNLSFRILLRGVAALLAAAFVLPSFGDDAADPVPMNRDRTVAVGSVRVDPVARTLAVPGWVNQVSGAIELLACGPGGKTHESVLVLDVDPVDLQTALLLLGLKPGQGLTGLGQGRPQGAEVDLWVDWQGAGGARSERAERFVFNTQARKVLPKTPWIFTGSVVEEGDFKASAEESLVATYWDPWAIINIALPCGTNDEILSVNTNIVPPLQTRVTFRIRAR
jgi:hypothetical protein